MPPTIDLSEVFGFQWDEGNNRKSEDRHGVRQLEAEQVFSDGPLIVDRDIHHSLSEQRYNALGSTVNGRLLHITFTLRNEDTAIRIVSARDMNRRERHRYAEEA